jgi:hypothetical protein
MLPWVTPVNQTSVSDKIRCHQDLIWGLPRPGRRQHGDKRLRDVSRVSTDYRESGYKYPGDMGADF